MKSLAGFLLDLIRAAGVAIDCLVVAAQDIWEDDE